MIYELVPRNMSEFSFFFNERIFLYNIAHIWYINLENI